MSKDNEINIKLEVCRDNTSGKLIILAHFDSKSPNVFIDKDNYSWMPSIEEFNLITDAFDFFPTGGTTGHLGKTTVKPSEKKEEKPITEPIIEEPAPIQDETIDTEEIKPIELPPLEKSDKSTVFERTEDETKTDRFEKELDKVIDEIDEEIIPKTDDKLAKPSKEEESDDDKKEKDEALLVEADGDAIERALKKHTDSDKDDSMVEVDEQMIIDKVLSQKKKGKWSKK